MLSMKKALFVVTLLAFQVANAQESINTAGNQAIGAGGFIEYTFGQVFVDLSGDLTTIQPGVQQVYNSSIVTNVNEREKSTIHVIPNPASKEVTIRNEQGRQIKSIEIFNVAGLLVELINVNEIETSINLKHLANGIYFFRITSREEIPQTIKVIKQAH
jgi:hypothetical protein